MYQKFILYLFCYCLLSQKWTLCKKCTDMEFFLVRIFLYSDQKKFHIGHFPRKGISYQRVTENSIISVLVRLFNVYMSVNKSYSLWYKKTRNWQYLVCLFAFFLFFLLFHKLWKFLLSTSRKSAVLKIYLKDYRKERCNGSSKYKNKSGSNLTAEDFQMNSGTAFHYKD